MDKNKSIDGLSTHRSKKTAMPPAPVLKPRKPTKPNQSTHKVKTITKTTHNTKVKTKPASKVSKNPKTRKTPKAIKPIEGIPPQPTPISQPNLIDQPISTEQPTSTQPTPLAPADITADFLTPTQVFNFNEETGELQASDTPANTTTSSAPTTPNINVPNSPTNSPIQNPKKPKKAKKPVSKKRKIITTIILVIILLLIGAVTWFICWGNDIIAKITGGQGNVFDLFTFFDEHYEPLKTDANGRTNILAFGTSGYNMEGEEGNGVHDGAQLTDSIMILSLDQETGDIAMLSLPRDLKASPTCTATGKINEVYWCNNMDKEHEPEGAEALMAEVSKILGIDFQYYAHLNWGSLVQIVNTLGGITVTLDEGIYDYYYTKAVFEPGVPYTIDGEQALGLARARHGTTSGDFSRGASQQKILIGIKDKVHEKNFSITDLTDIAGTLGDNLRTNFNVEELKTLAHLTSSFDFNTMRQISLIEPEMFMTTGTINGISYVLPVGGAGYYTKIQNYVAKMFSSDPRQYENASILILNGTDTAGLASTEQSALESEGYTNTDIGDAPAGEYTDQYYLYALADDKPGTKKLLEEHYSTESKSLDNLPAGANQYYDFVIILGDTSSGPKE